MGAGFIISGAIVFAVLGHMLTKEGVDRSGSSYGEMVFSAAHCYAVVGLTLTFVFAVLVDEGKLVYYSGVGVGVVLACVGFGLAWSLVKDEHMRR